MTTVHGWDANGSPVADEQEEPTEPTPEERVAQLTASCNAMEQKLREAGMKVDIGQVNIGDLRLFATSAAALRLLVAKGLASQSDIDLSVLSVLHECLAGLMIGVDERHLSASPPAPQPSQIAIARSMPNRATRRRHD